MSKEICFVFNFAPHYREEVFHLINETFNCDFYFGDRTYTNIKKMNYDKLNLVRELKFIKLFNNFYFLKGQAGLSFKKYQKYVITGQPYNVSAWFLLVLNRLLGKKTFIWNHGFYGNEGFLNLIIKKIQFKLASGYLVYGQYAKELMIKNGCKENKLHVIYNSLGYRQQLQVRNSLKITNIYKNHFSNELPVVIFIGRLTKIKKLDLLLGAMKLSFTEGFKYNVVFVGDGSEKQSLQKEVKKNGMEKFTWFFGSLYSEPKIGELLFNADVCVSPGNVGLTAIHALTFGCPVITHDEFTKQMPEFEAIHKGFTGDFYNFENVRSLNNTIKDWILEHPKKDSNLLNHCFEVIDNNYNPEFQITILKKVLHEGPPD